MANWALVVGINSYKRLRSLRYAERDAQLMRDYFENEAGFERVFYFADNSKEIEAPDGSLQETQPIYANLISFLHDFFEYDEERENPPLAAGDNLWFFFSGHGLRYLGEDYLVPSNGNPRLVRETNIALSYVTQRLRRSGADNVMLLLDACRNENELGSKGVGIEKQQGVITIASCSPQQESYEIEEIGQGSFTYALLEALRIQGEGNCATVERLYQHLRHRVAEINDSYQKPIQTPYAIVEPASKYHLILLPDYATLTDIATLKIDAFQAEAEEDWELAKQLWVRVNVAARGSDLQAIQAFYRISQKQGQSPSPRQERVVSIPEKGGGERSAASESSPVMSLDNELQTFSFEVVKVNDKGEEVNRKEGQAQYFREELGNGVGLEMVYIPGGSFMMGSPEEESGGYEKPQHRVIVQPFFMGKFQITQAQWKEIASLPKVKLNLKPDPSNFKGDDLPVETVIWDEAVEFCRRLSLQTGKEYRLPSEAEWEYACRAGTITPFHFGWTITRVLANYCAREISTDEQSEEFYGETTTVGSFPPNAFGLYDMHGNVWEWCEDNYHENYDDAPTDGSSWLSGSSDIKVMRGGSWYNPRNICCAAFRNFPSRDLRYLDFGFRVVCVISKNKSQQNLQQSLQLTEEEVSQIEKPIIEQKEAEAAQKRKEEEKIRQQQKAEEEWQQREETERLKKQQEIENRSRVIETVPDSKPTIEEGIKLQVCAFEVVTVNVQKKLLGLRTEITLNYSHSQAQYFTEVLGNGVGLDMVYIPGGEFMMGSPQGEVNYYNENDNPQHEVTVNSFFIGKFQITQAQWRTISLLPKINCYLRSGYSDFKGDDLPVEQVSWDDAEEFCQRLSKQTGKEYRLPSEAEWEYACRAGTTTPFHFGETITDKLANYRARVTFASEPKGEYRQKTTPVGSFPPNTFGLYDMHGNVWEWCEDDWHDNYQGAPIDGSAWISRISSRKVLRGGSWYNSPDSCRSGYRYDLSRNGLSNRFGFRVVCVAPRTT